MSDKQVFYVQGGDGQFYAEHESAGGEPEYVPAEPGLSFQEMPNGKFAAVRDLMEQYQKTSSHERYFQNLRESDDPRKQRQALKRLDKLQQQFERLAVDRVSPVGVPGVEVVTDEKFEHLMNEYKAAVREGREREAEFQPVTTYQAKLVLKDGRVLRPLYAGEVGMRGATVIVLEAGYGTGNMISVPGKVGG